MAMLAFWVNDGRLLQRPAQMQVQQLVDEDKPEQEQPRDHRVEC